VRLGPARCGVRWLPAVAALLASLACSRGPGERLAWTSVDPWYAPPPPGLRTEAWGEVERDRIFVVPDACLGAAIDRLGEAPAALLSRPEASGILCGRRTHVWSGRPVLLRGLVLDAGAGAFSVRASGNRLSVRHRSRGRDPLPMAKRPIVVFMDDLPTEVWVSVSMTE